MRERRTDKRVIKTRAALRRAMAELMSERDVSDITPSDVAERALVSRKTFHAHYPSVLALVDEMESDAVGALEDAIASEESPRLGASSIQHMLERLRAMAADKTSELGVLLDSRMRDDLWSRVGDMIERRLVQSSRATGARARYAASFVAGGVVSCIRSWFATGDASAREVSAQLSAMLSREGEAE